MADGKPVTQELGHEFGWGAVRWRQARQHRIRLQRAVRDERRAVVDGIAGNRMMLVPR